MKVGCEEIKKYNVNPNLFIHFIPSALMELPDQLLFLLPEISTKSDK